MNTQGHHAIATEVGEEMLKDAFEAACYGRPRLGAFYFGNWLTDVSQAVDLVAFAGFREKANGLINGIFRDAKDFCRRHVFIDETIATTARGVERFQSAIDIGTQCTQPPQPVESTIEALDAKQKEILASIDTLLSGDLEKAIRSTFKVCGYFKFVHPVAKIGATGKSGGRSIDYQAYLKIFEKRYTYYYPHEHLDRPEILGASLPDRPAYESDVDSTLGIYKYMRDHIEIVAGQFAQLDLEWAPQAFRPGNPIDDRKVDYNTHLAELGHALHLVEDFFAHSNFCEHAAQSLGPEFLDWKTVAFDRVGIFKKRLKQQHHPGWEEDLVRDEPNVVTGFFDIKDTLVSLTHVAEEFLGHQEWLESAGEFVDEKLGHGKTGKVIGHLHTVGGAHTTAGDNLKNAGNAADSLFDALKDPVKATENYQKLIHQTLETFAYWPDIDNDAMADNEVAQKLLTTGQIMRGRPIDPQVSRTLLDGMNLPDEIANNFVEMVELWTRTKLYIDFGKGAWNLYKALKTVCEVVAAPEVMIRKLLKKWFLDTLEEKVVEMVATYVKNAVYARFLGAQRLGCHSLLAKDHGYEPMAEYAAACARAVHGYIIRTLVRWAEPNPLKVCRMPTSGSPYDHINTSDVRPWIDWEDLLFFHLRHPVKATPDQRPPTIVEIRKLHEANGGETLGMIVLKYRPTAFNSADLNVQSLCGANSNLRLPITPGYAPPRGTVLVIPHQKEVIDHRDPVNRNRAWWRPIFEKKDWKALERHDPWQDNVSKQTVPVSYHVLKPVRVADVQKLIARSRAKLGQFEAKYAPPTMCIPVPRAQAG